MGNYCNKRGRIDSRYDATTLPVEIQADSKQFITLPIPVPRNGNIAYETYGKLL